MVDTRCQYLTSHQSMVDVTGPQKFVAISTLQSGQFDVALYITLEARIGAAVTA